MVFLDLISGMAKVGDRFPGAVFTRVVLPMDKVLSTTSVDAVIKDFSNFEFFVTINDVRRRWWWRVTSGKWVWDMGFEE